MMLMWKMQSCVGQYVCRPLVWAYENSNCTQRTEQTWVRNPKLCPHSCMLLFFNQFLTFIGNKRHLVCISNSFLKCLRKPRGRFLGISNQFLSTIKKITNLHQNKTSQCKCINYLDTKEKNLRKIQGPRYFILNSKTCPPMIYKQKGVLKCSFTSVSCFNNKNPVNNNCRNTTLKS